MNNFEKYSQREALLFNNYLQQHSWLANQVLSTQPENTGLHDMRCVLKNGKSFTIEIKEEENYWYSKTGNIGLDLISSFTYKQNKLYWQAKNNWIPIAEIQKFLQDIQVSKWGKLITCDAHVQLYCVENVFYTLYNNSLLKQKAFLQFLKTNFPLRINNKANYKLADTWESAAYFINPNITQLQPAVINNMDDLLRALD
jgi:hypothetical protein